MTTITTKEGKEVSSTDVLEFFQSRIPYVNRTNQGRSYQGFIMTFAGMIEDSKERKELIKMAFPNIEKKKNTGSPPKSDEVINKSKSPDQGCEGCGKTPKKSNQITGATVGERAKSSSQIEVDSQSSTQIEPNDSAPKGVQGNDILHDCETVECIEQYFDGNADELKKTLKALGIQVPGRTRKFETLANLLLSYEG